MPAPSSRRTAAATRLLRPVVLAAAALLTGCALVSHGGHHGPRDAGGPGPVLSPRGTVLEPTVVQVGLSAAGTPVVTQEPVVIPRDLPAGGRIAWRLPPDGGLSFPDNGVVIEGRVVEPSEAMLRRFGEVGKPSDYRVVLDKAQKTLTGCRRASPIEFTCENARDPGRFLYTLRLLKDGQPLEPLDPTVINAR